MSSDIVLVLCEVCFSVVPKLCILDIVRIMTSVRVSELSRLTVVHTSPRKTKY